MTYDSNKRHRRSIRLQGYDYAQAGAYFVTISTQGRTCLFGDIMDGVMRSNAAGQMIQSVWDEIPRFYPGVDIDAFAVMPNHIHGIIILVGAAPCGRPDSGQSKRGQPQGVAPTYAYIPGFYKSATLDDIRRHGYVLTPGRYVGAAPREEDDEPFAEKMQRLVAQLREQQTGAARLNAAIARKEEFGYDR